MRDLASIVTVEKTWPLEGKDKVQGASFKENSYEVMIGKNVQVGDRMVFIQEGAILPEIPHWEFLRSRCYKASLGGFLIKPMTFATIKSWGLACELEEMKDLLPIKKLKAGMDVTEKLNIRKYEPELDASPTEKLNGFEKWLKKYCTPLFKSIHKTPDSFPSMFIDKSDETTIQNLKGLLEKNQDVKVYVTQKLEGQSFTVMLNLNKKGLLICSRNRPVGINDGLFCSGANRYDIENKLKEWYDNHGEHLILQGEQCGPNIQNNIYKFKGVRWFLYTVKKYTKNAKDCQQCSLEEMKLISQELGIDMVPIVGEYGLSEIGKDLDAIVSFAENQYWTCKNGDVEFNYKPLDNEKLWKQYAQAEGIVVRSMDYDKSKNKGFSFKVKNIEYAKKGLGAISSMTF